MPMSERYVLRENTAFEARVRDDNSGKERNKRPSNVPDPALLAIFESIRSRRARI